jgi:hypothetical protein
MSLYEFSCIRSGWMLANGGQPEDSDKPIEEDDFEKILAAHEERSAQATRVLDMGEVLAMNKDKVRQS